MAEPITEAQGLIGQARWSEALSVLASIQTPSGAVVMLRQFAGNMQAMRQHRPDVYGQLFAAPADRTYQVINAADGLATVAHVDDGGDATSLSPGNRPKQAVPKMLEAFGKAYTDGSPLGLCGLGDGYLLSVLAGQPPTLFMDQQQAVHIIEPDMALLRTLLTLHDWSDEAGPIADGRFAWHIGPTWDEHFVAHLEAEPDFPPPGAVVQQGVEREAIAARMRQLSAWYQQHIDELGGAVERLYARPRDVDWSTLLSERSPRPPRVLLITCRFTTVLQYAARDMATAFEQAGWQAEVAMEKTGYHRLTYPALRKRLLALNPDAVFMIDHDRRGQPNLLPPQLPVVNWIQDHLPHLTTTEAGAAMSGHDFAMSFAAPMFTDTYGYPSRQVMDMPMMVTLPPTLPKRWANDGDDLVYVSNVSQQPRDIVEQVVAAQKPPFTPYVQRACQRMLELYKDGGALPTRWHLFRLIDQVQNELGGELSPTAREQFVHLIWNPLNSALYRQQALRWVAEAAEALGLSLAIYGNGWEKHPDFAGYARGPVTHGPDLEAVTRATKINLQLEPYPCCAHHRMLDGLASGGFFLVRHHPNNVLLQELSNFLRAHVPADAESAEAALAAVADEQRDALAALIDRAAGISYAEPPDPVKQVRCWQRAELLIDQPQLLPRLDAVSFTDAATCRQLIEQFVADQRTRRDIADEQRRNIIPRLTFQNTARRLGAFLADRLSAATSSDHAAA